jgi:hypothetical protein
MAFCAICTRPAKDAADLQLGEDLALECRACRTEIPVANRDAPRPTYQPEVPTKNLRRAVSAAYAKLADSGVIKRGKPTSGPARAIRPTPGAILIRVPVVRDGRTIDAVEAAETFAAQPWARQVRYLGNSRMMHVFERKAVT